MADFYKQIQTEYYEERTEDGLKYRMKRKATEKIAPPPKRMILKSPKANQNQPQKSPYKPASRSRKSCPKIPEIDFKPIRNYYDYSQDTRVAYVFSDIVDSVKSKVKETCLGHEEFVQVVENMLDKCVKRCKEELHKFNEAKTNQKPQVQEAHKQADIDKIWEGINTVLHQNPTNQKQTLTKQTLEKKVLNAKQAFKTLEALKFDCLNRAQKQELSKMPLETEFQDFQQNLKHKQHKQLTMLAQCASQTAAKKKQELQRNRDFAAQEFKMYLPFINSKSHQLLSSLC